MAQGRHSETGTNRGGAWRRLQERAGWFTTVTATALVAVILATGGGLWLWMQSGDSSDDENILLHKVQRDDFELTITERGEIDAFDVTEIRSLVKSNNTAGNAILRIVPEGTLVK